MAQFAMERGAAISLRDIEEVFHPPGVYHVQTEPVVRKVVLYNGVELIVTWVGEPCGDGFMVTNAFARRLSILPGDVGHFGGKILESHGDGMLVLFESAKGSQRLWMPRSNLKFLEERQASANEPTERVWPMSDSIKGGGVEL